MNNRRTIKKAGVVASIPEKLPIITIKTFQNAMSLNDDSNAHLRVVTAKDQDILEKINIYMGNNSLFCGNFSLINDDNLEIFNFPLLKVFYGIILSEYDKTIAKSGTISEIVTIYYPDFAEKIGKKRNISRKDVVETIKNILRFQNIVGIVGNDRSILPVLLYMGEDRRRNTISIASPYMVRIIEEIFRVSIKKNKNGVTVLTSNGTPELLPSHTFLPSMKLGKERNQKAVEIVCIIVATIEQAGSRTNTVPHISAKTIIERNPLLKHSIENTKNNANKNKYLYRAFSKAWELLRTHTDIMEKYKNIKLPDPEDKDFKAKYIPTMSTLDMVFEFPHEGKIKD